MNGLKVKCCIACAKVQHTLIIWTYVMCSSYARIKKAVEYVPNAPNPNGSIVAHRATQGQSCITYGLLSWSDLFTKPHGKFQVIHWKLQGVMYEDNFTIFPFFQIGSLLEMGGIEMLHCHAARRQHLHCPHRCSSPALKQRLQHSFPAFFPCWSQRTV